MSSSDEGVGVGFLVDKINTIPFQKAVERSEVPFCAFSPISTDELFLLRIEDCSDISRHMLVPASKDEVFNTPGALKNADSAEPGNENALNYQVAIVAIARQVYSEEQKQLVVSVEPLLKKDRKNINCVKFLSRDKFADFAFAGFDGNVSEFAKKSKNSDDKPINDGNQEQNQTGNEACTPPQVTMKDKSPIKAPSRRGRGGRRGGGRGRRSSSPSNSRGSPFRRGHRGRGSGNSRSDHGSLQSQQQTQLTLAPQNLFHAAFPTSSTAGTSFVQVPTFVKMEGQAEGDTQPCYAQVQFPMVDQMTQLPPGQVQVAYSGDEFNMIFPVEMPDVPMPCSEVTVGQTGAETDVPPPNHDILTIAIDQLMTLTYEPENDPNSYAAQSNSISNEAQRGKPERGTTGSRGGRRPGRKPGPKRLANDRGLQDMDENANCAFGIVGEVAEIKPKRRGRPPKNKVVLQVSGQENESSTATLGEEFGDSEKRLKLQLFGDEQ